MVRPRLARPRPHRLGAVRPREAPRDLARARLSGLSARSRPRPRPFAGPAQLEPLEPASGSDPGPPPPVRTMPGGAENEAPRPRGRPWSPPGKALAGVGTALKGFGGGGGGKPDAPRRALGNASNRSWIQVEHLQTREGPNLGRQRRRDVRELELVLFFTSYERIQLALLLQDHWHCDSSGRKLDSMDYGAGGAGAAGKGLKAFITAGARSCRPRGRATRSRPRRRC